MGFRILRFLLITAGFLTVACEKNESQVHITIRAKTSEGRPLAGAEVKVNEAAAGVTGADGSFDADLVLPRQQTVRVQVEKSSDDFYFSPHDETFLIKDVAVQDISVAAILYFVPKPGSAAAAQQDAGGGEILAENDFDQPASEGGMPLEEVEEPAALAALERVPGPASAPAPDRQEPDDGPAAVEPPPVSVSALPPDPSALVVEDAPREAVKESTPKAELFTFFAFFNKDEPVEGAEILYGDQGGGGTELKTLCRTNQRGRCIAEFQVLPKGPVTLMAKAEGFITSTVTRRLKAGGTFRFEMKSGHSIDFFILEKRFHRQHGIANADLRIGGKLVGKTDKFGHFTYRHGGGETDLISVEITAAGYLPETYATDFVAAGEIQLTRYFAQAQPAVPSVTVLPTQTAGDLNKQKFSGDEFKALTDRIGREVGSALNHQPAFRAIPVTAAMEKLGDGASMSRLAGLKGGWQKTALEDLVDNIVVPTLVVGDSLELELSFIDSQGRTVAVAKEPLPEIDGGARLSQAVDRILGRVVDLYPFEGAVLKADGENYVINLGAESSRGLKAGQVLKVFGTQLAKSGSGESYRQIATMKVTQVSPKESVAQVVAMEPRAAVQRGDSVVFTRGNAPTAGAAGRGFTVNVIEAGSPQRAPVSHANIYVNDAWVGSTDAGGFVALDPALARKQPALKVIKNGYEDHVQILSGKDAGKVDVQLKKKYSAMRVATEPPGAAVLVNGVLIGKSPIDAPIPVPGGFISLEVNGGDRFKRYRATLEVNHDVVDLTGENRIILEEDLVTVAEAKLNSGDAEGALKTLGQVTQHHSDYLYSRHRIGEILLTRKGDPAGAVDAFSLVLADPEVAKFINKKFIGTHINMSLALYRLAEKMGSDRDKALQALGQAVQILDQVGPQLRFVPKDQYELARHNVDFYSAMAKHKVWTLTDDRAVLAEALNQWRDYLDQHGSDTESRDAAAGAMLENAKVYYRQAQASSQSAAGETKL